MPPKFICDDCFMPFVIHIKVARKKTRKGVREQWLFSCPFCGKKYKAYDNRDRLALDSRDAAKVDDRARQAAAEIVS